MKPLVVRKVKEFVLKNVGLFVQEEEEGQEAEEVMAVFLMEGAMDPVTTKVNITMFSVVDYSFGFKADY